MKILTLNFLTCARKTCKSTAAAFPLHCREVELEQVEIDMNPLFIKNMLPRLDWEAMKSLTQELGLPNLPAETPAAEELTTQDGEPSQTCKDLHKLLMETSIASGKLVCGNCGHELKKWSDLADVSFLESRLYAPALYEALESYALGPLQSRPKRDRHRPKVRRGAPRSIMVVGDCTALVENARFAR